MVGRPLCREMVSYSQSVLGKMMVMGIDLVTPEYMPGGIKRFAGNRSVPIWMVKVPAIKVDGKPR